MIKFKIIKKLVKPKDIETYTHMAIYHTESERSYLSIIKEKKLMRVFKVKGKDIPKYNINKRFETPINLELIQRLWDNA